MHTDLYIARKTLQALRDVIILRPGQDAECLERLHRLVAQADAIIEDAQCKELLQTVLRYGNDLYSPAGPAKWERPRMSGASYLRLQMLAKLLVFNNRIAELETLAIVREEFRPGGSIPQSFIGLSVKCRTTSSAPLGTIR